ncbi:opacity protein-like surface antigen [Dysgonomonas sp. PH5-45]|uniref:outer membrane beta-barrel protein n=1 Tax=unclassified Dysgonomonas TaxID=2630389 RepID=UPI002473EE11|nr:MULTISPECIES: outer membrane beta-barrel protein [unclassified Dysgonomonas]MDH6355238.1 opacity protein-like surface antigen [Dysgonomonas sp. PH5-45]MDH6388139.1 opacity protein-like surface antigen [Dysgonomonas sp. PH5-37]
MLKNYFNKFTLTLCILLMGVGTATSQIKFGLKAGFDVAENKISKDILNAHNRMGFQVGPTVQFGLPLVGVGIDAALLYGYKDYKLKDNDYDAKLSNYNYLMVPVHIKKTFSLLGTLGVYAKGGPYAELKLGGGDFKFNQESLDKIKSKSFGMGLDFGVGVNLFSKLEVGMDYRFKLTDNYGEDKIGVTDAIFKSKKDKTWNVNVTYLF